MSSPTGCLLVYLTAEGQGALQSFIANGDDSDDISVRLLLHSALGIRLGAEPQFRLRLYIISAQ